MWFTVASRSDPDERVVRTLYAFRGLPAAVAAAIALAVAPSSASAAPYEVWSCRDAAGSPISAGAWSVAYDFTDASTTESTDSCASGGGYRAALAPGVARGVSGIDLRFAAPRGTTITDFELWRSVRIAGDGSSFQANVDEVVGGNAANPASACFASSADPTCGTDPTSPLSAANRWTKETPGPLDLIKIVSRCGQSCPASSPVAVESTLYRSRVVLDDPTAPAAAVTGGTLAAGAPVSGQASLSLAARDRESGVASVTLAVDGGAPTTIDSGNSLNACHLPYVDPQPCPADTERLFLVDTSTLTPGAHQVAGTAVDAAGNTTPWGPVDVVVAEPPVAEEPPAADPPAAIPPSAAVPPAVVPPAAVSGGAPDNGAPAVLRPRVDLRIEPGKAGVGPRIVGTVRTPAGRAIAGARLRVVRTPLGTAPNAKTTTDTVTTDAHGRFVAPRRSGAHRVRATFAPWDGAPVTRSVERDVRTTLRLSAESRQARRTTGQTYTLRGRVRGAGQATPRTPVQIEAIVRGRWRVVGTTRLSSTGRWTWRYRFRSVTRPTRFAFRATVLSAPAWPWSTRHSGRVHVHVDPR
ncbi:hypothetical protein AB0L40_23175 [Patulibacter sp. NPDC049589]|uniref:hypothetical protein n=1 Tax=Patulibacter sp. NPDC049589 TaxID=3154731 RepID=UPI0034159E3A